jgi:hypothetical protein
MLPTKLQLGGAAVRRSELKLSGVNAAKLITHMEVSNLAATGLFDGASPGFRPERRARVGWRADFAPGWRFGLYVGALSLSGSDADGQSGLSHVA